jgi:FkbM family methyltransferase
MYQRLAPAQRLIRSTKRFLRCIRAFGVAPGVAVFFKLYVLAGYSNAARIIFVRIPGSQFPVVLRPQTSDIAIFEQIFLENEYDFEFPAKFSPRLIIDGGANIGLAAVYFARRYPQARIVSIEPERSNFEMLQRNASGYSQIKPIRAAIWSTSESLRIKNPNADKWIFQIDRSGGSDHVDVPGVTIDQIAREYGAGEVDLLKLDIEGAEKEVFSSHCDEWIERTQVMIVELHDWIVPGCGKAFFSATSKHPFNYFHRGEHEILISQRFSAPS